MESGRDDGRTGRALPDLIACLLRFILTGRIENGAANAAACHQPAVRRVHNGVGFPIDDAVF